MNSFQPSFLITCVKKSIFFFLVTLITFRSVCVTRRTSLLCTIFVIPVSYKLKFIAYPFVFVPDMDKGCLADMVALGITESYKVKRQALISAAEAAEMILRVDDIIKAAPRYVFYRYQITGHGPSSRLDV